MSPPTAEEYPPLRERLERAAHALLTLALFSPAPTQGFTQGATSPIESPRLRNVQSVRTRSLRSPPGYAKRHHTILKKSTSTEAMAVFAGGALIAQASSTHAARVGLTGTDAERIEQAALQGDMHVVHTHPVSAAEATEVLDPHTIAAIRAGTREATLLAPSGIDLMAAIRTATLMEDRKVATRATVVDPAGTWHYTVDISDPVPQAVRLLDQRTAELYANLPDAFRTKTAELMRGRTAFDLDAALTDDPHYIALIKETERIERATLPAEATLAFLALQHTGIQLANTEERSRRDTLIQEYLCTARTLGISMHYEERTPNGVHMHTLGGTVATPRHPTRCIDALRHRVVGSRMLENVKPSFPGRFFYFFSSDFSAAEHNFAPHSQQNLPRCSPVPH